LILHGHSHVADTSGSSRVQPLTSAPGVRRLHRAAQRASGASVDSQVGRMSCSSRSVRPRRLTDGPARVPTIDT
jgi:hypothetical protein